ncbi:MAG TPA: hypothetical protein DCQ58_01550, partial [Saprospirales bacterium]|nr:hypothetical protein [Saprospirales bacterium]
AISFCFGEVLNKTEFFNQPVQLTLTFLQKKNFRFISAKKNQSFFLTYLPENSSIFYQLRSLLQPILLLRKFLFWQLKDTNP